jgi:hypothetical protein
MRGMRRKREDDVVEMDRLEVVDFEYIGRR